MKDKGDVCVMSENMPPQGLLLTGCRSNDASIWEQSDNMLPNCLKECQSHISSGLKRMREASPVAVDNKGNRIADEKSPKMKNGNRQSVCNLKIVDFHELNGTSNQPVPSSEEIIIRNGTCSDELFNENRRNNSQDNLSEDETETISDTWEDVDDDYSDTLENEDAIHKTISSNDNLNGDITLHPGLRCSLFPNVPPFVKFSTHDVQAEQLPIEIHKSLRWRMNKLQPKVIKMVVTNSGYRVFKESNIWSAGWTGHPKVAYFSELDMNQKINHIPGTYNIGRKDRLWMNIHRKMKQFDEKNKRKFNIMPKTFNMPRDKKQLRKAWLKTKNMKPWIVKPPSSSRGKGIEVVSKWEQLSQSSEKFIVQEYISNPLLINDTKFDLRIYVVVTSINPLRIYLYEDGLVRFASGKYSNDLTTLSDRYVHLTNYSVNRLSSVYEHNEDIEACKGHKWTLKSLWAYMENEMKADVSKIKNRIKDLVVKTILAAEEGIVKLCSTNLKSRYNAYELFGVDVILDQNFKPWLLEFNISPSLHTTSPLDMAVKGSLISNLFNMVGFHIPHHKHIDDTDPKKIVAYSKLYSDLGVVPGQKIFNDHNLYTCSLSAAEEEKHNLYTSEDRDYCLDSILDELTPDDVRQLTTYEDELTQIGSFQKLFPTKNSYKYLNYIKPRYYNSLLDAWESKYHNCREEGIAILREKCNKGVHLNFENAGTSVEE